MARDFRAAFVFVASLAFGCDDQNASEGIPETARTEIIRAPVIFSNLAISPDGANIAFTYTDEWLQKSVVEISLDASSQIAEYDYGCTYAVGHPSYSPDGQFMVMRLSEKRFLQGPPKSILSTDYLLLLDRVSGREILRIRDPIFENFEAPRFSADGQKIYYFGEMFVDIPADKIRPDSVRLYHVGSKNFDTAFDGNLDLKIVRLDGVEGDTAIFDAVAQVEKLAQEDRTFLRSLNAHPGPVKVLTFETTADAGRARLFSLYPSFVESEYDFGIEGRVSFQYGTYYGVLLLQEQPPGVSVWQYGIFEIGLEGRTPVLVDGMFIFDMAVSADGSRIAVVHAKGTTEPGVYSLEQTISVFDRASDGTWSSASLGPDLANISRGEECFPDGLPWQ